MSPNPAGQIVHKGAEVHVPVGWKWGARCSGYVWSTNAIYRAREIARQVSGVTPVVTSHLELEGEGRANGPAR